MSRGVVALVLASLAGAGLGSARGSAEWTPGDRAPAADSVEAVARLLLLSELGRGAAQLLVAHPVGERDARFAAVPSAAVPGLTYYWASYVPPKSAHMEVLAVAGARAGRVWLLRDAGDWWGLAREWRPADAAAAERACLELARVARRDGPAAPAAVFQPDSAGRGWATPAEVSALRRRARPRSAVRAPAEPDSLWLVSVWLSTWTEALVATRVRCTFPAGGGRRYVPAGLDEVDRITRAELPPPRRAGRGRG